MINRELFQSRLHNEMAELRSFPGYRNNLKIDNSKDNLNGNKYWIYGVIHGMRMALAVYTLLQKEVKNV